MDKNLFSFDELKLIIIILISILTIIGCFIYQIKYKG
jgi:hypothetical protein